MDDDDNDIDDDNRPPLEKHKALTASRRTSTSKAVFKYPPGRAPRHHETTASSNLSSTIGGDSQGHPFVVQDEDTKTSEKGTSSETRSVKSDIDTAYTWLNTSYSSKQPKTHHYSDPHATTELLDRSCSPSVAPFEDREGRTVHRDDHNGRSSAKFGSAGAITARPLAPERIQGLGGPAEVIEQEWEITKIFDKRDPGSEMEYRVCWKSTRLPKSEVGNARRLLREYEAKGRAQHGRKRGRSARIDKGW